MTPEAACEERLAGPRALLWGLLLGLVIWAGILFAVCAVSEAADGAGELADGIAQWQAVSGARFGPLTVHVAPLLPPIYYEGQAAQAWQRADGCEIRLDPAVWPTLSPAARQNVITHELGHCLGIREHSTGPGVMRAPLFDSFSAADGALARQIAPWRYAVALAEVAR